MGYESIEVSVEAKVAHIRLARPERMNALAATFWRELPAAVRELDAGGGVRAAVISSTGKHFTRRHRPRDVRKRAGPGHVARSPAASASGPSSSNSRMRSTRSHRRASR